MSEITTKVDGNSSVTKRYGAGSGGNARPELGRWIKITNSNSLASPLFENTTTEQESMYSNISGASNITVETGLWGIEGTNTLYSNTAAMGLPSGAACWSPSTPSATYATPPSCPSGFTDNGVTNTKDVQTSDEVNKTGVHNGDAGWMAYQYLGYYCPGSFVSNISVRECTT